MALNITEIEAKLKYIETQMMEHDHILLGFIKTNRNIKKRKDGSVYISKDYYTFVYKGVDGKQVSKRINEKFVPSVKKMVKNGQIYSKLATEHTALTNQLALTSLGEKKTKHPVTSV